MARSTDPKGARRGEGWQAEKSELTRTAVLEAVVECLVELGYAGTTTARIAEYAGVSRGAMMHHFPTRLELLQATAHYLYARRLEEYSQLSAPFAAPEPAGRERIARAVEALWKFANLASALAWQELLMAARTDGELDATLRPLERAFEHYLLNGTRLMLPRGGELPGAAVELASDLANALMQGMTLGHLAVNRQARARRLLAALSGQLERICLDAAAERSA